MNVVSMGRGDVLNKLALEIFFMILLLLLSILISHFIHSRIRSKGLVLDPSNKSVKLGFFWRISRAAPVKCHILRFIKSFQQEKLTCLQFFFKD